MSETGARAAGADGATLAASTRVAFVVTCFNDGATLPETVASIQRATEEVELVIIDDGSTDRATLNVLLQFEDQGITVVRQQNRGQAAAATVGVRKTSAPYVMRFDADDLLEPAAVEALADALDADPEASVAWGDILTFGSTNFRIPGVPNLDPWLVTYTNCITGSGTLVRRSALIESGGWQLREAFDDWDLWMTLAELGRRGTYVPKVIFRYRRDELGQLSRWLDQLDSHYEQLRRRHTGLFLERRVNRRRSAAPLPLKILVPLVEILPGVSRLTKISLCELFARLFLGGGLRRTAPMVRQAVALRIRRRLPKGRT